MLQHSNLAGSTWNVWHLGFWQWWSTFHRLRLQGSWWGCQQQGLQLWLRQFCLLVTSLNLTMKGQLSIQTHLQVEQSNGAPDDYYICNWTAPEWRALTPQSILPNSPPSLFKTCYVDHLSNCQLADLWCVLIVPTYKVIVAVVHNNVLYWVAMWNKLVPWQQHGGMRQILLLINNWGNSDQTFELHLIEVYMIPNSGRSPNFEVDPRVLNGALEPRCSMVWSQAMRFLWRSLDLMRRNGCPRPYNPCIDMYGIPTFGWFWWWINGELVGVYIYINTSRMDPMGSWLKQVVYSKLLSFIMKVVCFC